MNNNDFKIARKQLINISGLALGVALAMIISLHIHNRINCNYYQGDCKTLMQTIINEP